METPILNQFRRQLNYVNPDAYKYLSLFQLN